MMDNSTRIDLPGASLHASATDMVEALKLELAATAPGTLRVIRRNNGVTPYDDTKISVALAKAFLAVEGNQAAASDRIHEVVAEMTARITSAFHRRWPLGAAIHIEAIQDQVELELMRNGEHKVARAYVLYREQRRQQREQEAQGETKTGDTLLVTLTTGEKVALDEAWLRQVVQDACQGLTGIDPEVILNDTRRSLFAGVPIAEVEKALIMSARAWIETEPNYSFVSARLLLDQLRNEAFGFLQLPVGHRNQAEMQALYSDYFKRYVARGIELELLDPQLQ